MFLACCDWETAIDNERNYDNFSDNKFIEDSN
jgi:hypothetical protein